MMLDMGVLPIDYTHISNVLISHGHLDHSAGIPYYISQRSLQKLPPPKIYVNSNMYEPLSKIIKLYSEMEYFDYKYHLVVVNPGDWIRLNNRFCFTAFPTFHRIPSQGYTIYEMVKKLKPEYIGLSEQEIIELRKNQVEVSEEKKIPTISFSGDTQIEYLLEHEDVQNSRVLFLECTYMDDVKTTEKAREWGHTHLYEIIANADKFKNEKVVLMHFSKRYSNKEILDRIQKLVPSNLKEKIYCLLTHPT